MTAAVPALGAETVFSDQGLVTLLGGGAAALALLGLLLLVPLYLTHRSQVARLLAWKDREPDAGTTEFRAVEAPWEGAAQPGPVVAGAASGRMTPAERVTSERPALARITTAERDAIARARAPLWRRELERGPRHPLVLSILALLVAAAVIFAASQLIRSNSDDSQRGGRLDRGAVSVVVLNASSSPGVAGKVSDDLTEARFTVAGTSVAPETAKRTAVLFAAGSQPAAKAVARSLGLPPSPEPFDAEADAAADGADVVVLAGDDRVKASGGGKG